MGSTVLGAVGRGTNKRPALQLLDLCGAASDGGERGATLAGAAESRSALLLPFAASHCHSSLPLPILLLCPPLVPRLH